MKVLFVPLNHAQTLLITVQKNKVKN